MTDDVLIAIIVAKSDAFWKSLGSPPAFRAKATFGTHAFDVIVTPFGGAESAAKAVGCERIALDTQLDPDDVVFEQIAE